MSTTERILITGSGGMLGDAVYPVFKQAYEHVHATDIDLNEPHLSYLDVRDAAECRKLFDEVRPTMVIHLAALTDLEYCEKHPEDGWDTNALGTENIARLAESHGAVMMYVSTAGIFDGVQEEYTDFDTPNPLGVYGRSKFHGEQFVGKHCSRHLILRAGWMMGGGPQKDKKFINKIFKQIQGGTRELKVVDDKLGTPTYTLDFARSMLRLLNLDTRGLYNHVCEGGGSRFDVAVDFLKHLGLQDKISVARVSSDYFKDAYFAPRPPSEKLINLKLTQEGLNTMRTWQECLKEYAEVYKQQLNG